MILTEQECETLSGEWFENYYCVPTRTRFDYFTGLSVTIPDIGLCGGQFYPNEYVVDLIPLPDIGDYDEEDILNDPWGNAIYNIVGSLGCSDNGFRTPNHPYAYAGGHFYDYWRRTNNDYFPPVSLSFPNDLDFCNAHQVAGTVFTSRIFSRVVGFPESEWLMRYGVRGAPDTYSLRGFQFVWGGAITWKDIPYWEDIPRDSNGEVLALDCPPITMYGFGKPSFVFSRPIPPLIQKRVPLLRNYDLRNGMFYRSANIKVRLELRIVFPNLAGTPVVGSWVAHSNLFTQVAPPVIYPLPSDSIPQGDWDSTHTIIRTVEFDCVNPVPVFGNTVYGLIIQNDWQSNFSGGSEDNVSFGNPPIQVFINRMWIFEL